MPVPFLPMGRALLGGVSRWLPGYDLILLGDSTFQQDKLSVIGGTSLDAMARGAIYHYLANRGNVHHSNKCDATNYWNGDVNAVARRGFTDGFNKALGGSSFWGSVIDQFAADGVTPAELAVPWSGATVRRRRRIVLIGPGTNDFNTGRTAAQLKPKAQAEAAYVLAQGDIPVMRTCLARTSDNVTYAGVYWALNDDKRNQMGLYNLDLLSGSWCGPGQAIEIWDPNVDIADLGVADNWGRFTTPKANMLGDGLHPGSLFGSVVGTGSLDTTLSRIIPAGTAAVWPTSALDALNLAYAGGLNAGFTGTGGAKSGTGVNVGGNVVADGFGFLRGGSAPVGGSTGVSVVLSKEAVATGRERGVAAFTPGGTTTYESFVQEIYSAGSTITLPANLIGQRVRWLLDIEWSAWGGWTGFPYEIVYMDSGSTPIFRGYGGKQGNALTDRWTTNAGRYKFWPTEVHQIPANAAKFSCIMTLPILCAATGTGTLKTGDLRCVAEGDPMGSLPSG